MSSHDVPFSAFRIVRTKRKADNTDKTEELKDLKKAGNKPAFDRE